MTYLIMEMLVWLLLAAAIGFGAAWFLRGQAGFGAATSQSAADWSFKVTALEAEYQAKLLAAEAANARLRADLHTAQQAAAGTDGQRHADLAAALKIQIQAAEALVESRGQALEQSRIAFQSAQNEWRDRLAYVEEQNARLAEALDTAQAQLAAVSAPASPSAESDARG